MGILWYGLGMVLAAMFGVALGHGIVQDHGRKIVPLLALCTVALGLLLGWSLNAFLNYVQTSGTIAT